jgi:hypothetical protein
MIGPLYAPVLESEGNHNDSITGHQLADLHSTMAESVKTGVPARRNKRGIPVVDPDS